MNKLMPGQNLQRNESITSDNGYFKLILQNDGNLVLYQKVALSSDIVKWATGTQVNNVKECLMQEDGNLVLYEFDSNPVWDSATCGKDGAYLVLQDDGNLVIYHEAVVWNT